MREDDRKNENEHHAWANAPIYQETSNLLENLEEYYHKEFASLVYGMLPEFNTIHETLHMIAKTLNEKTI